MDSITVLLILLGLISSAFTAVFVMDLMKHKEERVLGEEGQEVKGNIIISGIIGFVTNFFDTLGIGSFAPSTFAFKTTKTVDMGVVPGTLNVAHTLPVVFMAFLYIRSVEVEPLTLFLLIGASVAGAYLGAGFVARMNKRTIIGVMGFALIVIAVAMFARNIGWLDFQAEGVTGLTGFRLILGIIGFFILGALMTAGVGLYSPAMALVWLLGMQGSAAFPIMMGACAFLMSVAGIRFVREGKYARKQSLAIAFAGIPGVWIAFQFFSGLFNLGLLIYLVIVVITITAIMMIVEFFRTADKGQKTVEKDEVAEKEQKAAQEEIVEKEEATKKEEAVQEEAVEKEQKEE